MEPMYVVKIIIACAFFLYALIMTVILLVKKIKARKAAGDEITVSTIFKDIANIAVGFIGTTEKAYSELTGKTGIKTGSFKLESVLNKIRDVCTEKDVTFDKDYWTTFINNVVETINISKNNSSQVEKTEFNLFKEK